MNPTLSAPPLSLADTITVLPQRYPEALICVACGRLLATRREASATLSDAARVGYVCCGCRQTAAEAARVHAVRREVARQAALAAADARRARGRPQDEAQSGAGARQRPPEDSPVVHCS